MAGEEELRARAVLDEMQMRISRGPYDALGLSEYATSDDVRSAFLTATKKFHPARFGRMSPDLQKLANEVFLGIKGAHDYLQRILGGSMTRPGIGGASGSSQAIPVQTHGAGTGKTPAPQLLRRTGQLPPLEQSRPSGQHRAQLGTSPPITQPHSQPIARGTERPGTPPARAATPPMNTPAHGMPRPMTPPMNTPAHGMQRPATPPMNTPGHGMQRPGTPPVRPTPASGIPIQRPGTPPTGARPNTPQPGARPTTPAGRPLTPPTTPPRPSADLKPPTSPPRPSSDLKPPTSPPRPSSDLKPPTSPPRGFDINPPTVRGVQPAAAFDERSALRESMMLLNDRNWSAARQALHNLAAKVPQSKSYRALLCYARGRETQAAGRPDEALLEYQRALQLEPTLDLATQAIAELRRR